MPRPPGLPPSPRTLTAPAALLVAVLSVALAAPRTALAEGPPPQRLTVEEAVRVALRNHPNLAAARQQLAAAHAVTNQAWSALGPGLTGSFAYQPQTANFAGTPAFNRILSAGSVSIGTTCAPGDASCAAAATPCVLNATSSAAGTCFPTSASAHPKSSAHLYNYFSAQVGLYWTLFDFGQTWYGIGSARASEQAVSEAAQATSLQVELGVRTAFYSAVLAEVLVDVARDSVATEARHLVQMQAFFEVGTRTKVDVAQARSNLAAAQLQLVQAQGQRQATLASLHAALGLDEWKPLELVAPLSPEAMGLCPGGAAVPSAIPGLQAEAVAQRPEQRQLEAQARALDDQAKSTLGSFFPTLSLVLGPSFAGTELTNLTPNFTLTLQLSYPLGGMNPFATAYQYKAAKANERATLEQARAERNTIRLQVAQAQVALETACMGVVAATSLLAATTEQRELANGQFEAGLGTVLNLEDAELGYVNARAQQVQAQYNVWAAQAQLDQALGR